MKRLITILLLTLSVNVFAQKAYNVVGTKLIDLYRDDNKAVYDSLVKAIKELDVDVVRFRGGNEIGDIHDKGYNSNFTQFAIKFFKDCGIKEVIHRVDIDNFDVSLREYQDLINGGIEVNLIGFGNEDYFKVESSRRWLWFIGSIKRSDFSSSAKKYAKKFLEYIEYCKSKGHGEIADKIVWETHFLTDAGNSGWHNTLKSELANKGFTKVDIHSYGDVNNSNYHNQVKSKVGKNFKGLKTYCFERRGIAYHNLSDSEKEKYIGSRIDAEWEEKSLKLMDDIGCELAVTHTLFHWNHYDNYYAEIIMDKKTGAYTKRK